MGLIKDIKLICGFNIQSEMNIYIFIFNETELKYFNNGIK